MTYQIKLQKLELSNLFWNKCLKDSDAHSRLRSTFLGKLQDCVARLFIFSNNARNLFSIKIPLLNPGKLLKTVKCAVWANNTDILAGYAILIYVLPFNGLPGGLENKESACNVGDLVSIPGLRRFPGEGNGYSLRCSCLKNPTDRGAWRGVVHGLAMNQM